LKHGPQPITISTMNEFITRPMAGSRKGGEFLGSCLIEDKALFFARGNGKELVVIAGPVEPEARVFARGKYLQFEYRTFPRDESGNRVNLLAEQFVTSLFNREKGISEALGKEADEGRFLYRGAGAFPVLQSVAEREQFTTYRVAMPGAAGTGIVKIGDRGQFSLDLFGWSASLELDGGTLKQEQAVLLQQFFLTVVGRFMVGLPRLGQEEQSNRKETSQAAFLYFDLGKPDLNKETLSQAAIMDGGSMVLSLDVPSSCNNKCVFCAPSKGLEGNASCEGALEELDRLWQQMQPVFEKVGRVDVNLVGMDVFNFPAFETLLARLRAETRVSKISCVSPGARLTEPEFVDALAHHRLDGVTLTLLGPDPATHDLVAGRQGAYQDLMNSIGNLRGAGVHWELNSVVVLQNLRQYPQLLSRAGELGSKVRVYYYVTEPFFTEQQARECYPRYADFVSIIEKWRSLFEANVLSLHYVPLCVLPLWARQYCGHASQQFPDTPEATPEECAQCPAYLKGCTSITAHYLALFGDDELKRLDD
jgi:MoaA/NifB/PqqE/SkfB family radical SAM enzyme